MSKPYLSIVIPAHNEAHRLPYSLEKIGQFLKSQDYQAEVLVVENGSRDQTLNVAAAYQEKMPGLHIYSEDKRGKGLAVRRGMLEAKGEYRFLCDADLSMPIEQINRFLPPKLDSSEVSIGSRELPGSRRFNEPNYRHVIGRIFNAMVRWIVLPGIQDSQCGFKCFRGDIAEEVFGLQTLDGMAFDSEVLFIARRKGYGIQEIAIDWYFDPDSRVRLVKDSLAMAIDLLKIRRNAARGYYDA